MSGAGAADRPNLLLITTDQQRRDRTTIVFTSDHGEFLGDDGTGNKVFFHEATAGVPMIVRPAAGTSPVPPGTVVRTPVTLADVLPTLVAAAGGSAGADVDGTDLVALAAGGDRPRVVVGVASGDTGPPGLPYYLAMTDGRHKYVWYPEGPTEQLFDLVSDPDERHDLALAAASATSTAPSCPPSRRKPTPSPSSAPPPGPGTTPTPSTWTSGIDHRAFPFAMSTSTHHARVVRMGAHCKAGRAVLLRGARRGGRRPGTAPGRTW